MLIAALLLCSLIRALPPACNRHDTANNAPSPEPVEVSRPVDNSAARIAPSPSLDAQNAISPPPSSAPIDSSSFQRLSTPPTSDSDCKCGYTLSAHSNAYFPSAHIVSFSSLPNGPLSISDLTNLGFEVNNQHQVGGVYKGTKSVGSINALSGQDGALAMTVKGGQAMGGDIEAAEIIFQPEGGMTGGVFGMEAVFDPTPGTCQAMVGLNILDCSGSQL